ncbi:hypothetical protein [Caldisalinibacter kiritimatiensis]|uniref:Uncharacterized protein n=1 Tax=Caldisalinibacter kiritimatiensis TaxID=1304284 RepID=R1CKP0_9FIRM|nr:hypothetical protein [Caldisalinibacter kiritimatiensis]EOC99290.1 hypothetical protein L21TH_2674 [Caldisalinibacter kiritimatiensis]
MIIEGYFRSIKRANETVEQLKNAGYSNVYSDMNDHYIPDRNTQINLPGAGVSTSLSELTMKSGEPILDSSLTPLNAADPMVSGMGPMEEIADINCKVVVKTDNENIQQAKDIIENNGGIIGNPTPKRPKKLDDININNIELDFPD